MTYNRCPAPSAIVCGNCWGEEEVRGGVCGAVEDFMSWYRPVLMLPVAQTSGAVVRNSGLGSGIARELHSGAAYSTTSLHVIISTSGFDGHL